VQADVESRIREQLLTYNIIDSAVRSRISINPNEVTEFYNQHSPDFRIPQQWQLESLAVEDEAKAKELADSAANGQPLNVLADTNALSLNKINVIRGQLRQDVEEMIFKLKIGEAAGPVKIEEKYYIFRLVNIIPPRMQTLQEVRGKIYTFLFNQRMQDRLIEWIDGLRARSYIKIFQD